ncbi:MAG: hypothetical protein A2275_08190 [Bacteroidetes bacterium RIFOXYA12_FULL_35_11]|nr:MAG: hypothetical protein A2X01_11210 [Bacteroidetes bacterium GWF2_35_48]OFY82646.1 MAG: hypothetical protein A2275_08190 [Bacteroidetes bacterium RIFOXYA12_FULL_35_11]OFY94525.1 MAG: hypothetical protein A2309_02310 [Bacteroidetes bacterium RIFOXYB2_FULL_35_7]
MFASSGGPDAFGYTWKDSNEPGGPVYNWADISLTGIPVLGLGDDNYKGIYSANFSFYWYTVKDMWIGSNGYICFGHGINIGATFPSIPDSTDNKHNFICGLLADLTFIGDGNPAKCYYQSSGDSVIVSYVNVPFYSSTYPYWTGSNTFQIIVCRSDKSITINFQSTSGTTLYTDIRTGIENVTGGMGLQPFYGSYPSANYTIKYYYPPVPSYFIVDGSVIWNTNPGSNGLFLPYPTNFSLSANIANTGNLDISPPITATGNVKNMVGISFVNTSKNFSNAILIDQDRTINYPDSFIPNSPGTYRYITTLSGISNDGIHSNDSLVQELVAIDTSSNIMTLNFTDNFTSQSISWASGTGGLGVYYIPPVYPVKIINTRYFIKENPYGASFAAKIYDDDGADGAPGTLLDSILVSGSDILIGSYSTINPTHDIIINSGGVYVAWEMNGQGIALAVDETPPFSYRTFEFGSNIWSEYRDNEIHDFMITLNIQKYHDPVSVQDFSYKAPDCLNIYPNPCNKLAVVEFSNPGHSSYLLKITDMKGNIINIKNGITSEEFTIDRDFMSTGIYFIELIGDKYYKGKLVVE